MTEDIVLLLSENGLTMGQSINILLGNTKEGWLLLTFKHTSTAIQNVFMWRKYSPSAAF